MNTRFRALCTSVVLLGSGAAALGQAVRLEWRFTGAGSGVFNGAYVDDVMITVP